MSADAALDKIGFGKFQWITLILSGIGFGAATVELVAVSQIKPFIQSKWSLSTEQLGLISTVTFLGEIFGGMVWAHLSDLHGRERVFMATSASMFLFSLCLPFCWTFQQFCWLRLLLGFAIGGGLSVDFVYFIECVPPRNRSFRSAFIILIGIAGVIYSATSGLVLLDRFGYEAFLFACCVPSGVLFLGRLMWRYESPNYLVAKGRYTEANRLLKRISEINGITGFPDQFDNGSKPLSGRVSHVELLHKGESNNDGGIKAAWFMITLASMAFFCQTSAYYGLTLWMSQFLRPWGVSPSLMLLLVGFAEIPGLIITSLFLKLYDANAVLLAVNFGAAALLSLVIYVVQTQKLFMCAFCALYFCIVSIWTILYSHIPERFPTLYRSRCFGIAGTFGKIGGMVSPILFGHLFGQPNRFPRILVHVIISGLFLMGLMTALSIKQKK